jgi:hypothetical protein
VWQLAAASKDPQIYNFNSQYKYVRKLGIFNFGCCLHKSLSLLTCFHPADPQAHNNSPPLHMNQIDLFYFSRHPSQVAGVVGRAEILCSVFFLAAFIFYTRAARRKKSTGK